MDALRNGQCNDPAEGEADVDASTHSLHRSSPAVAEDAGARGTEAGDTEAGDTGADDAGTPHPSARTGTLADADALFHAGVGRRIRRIRRARGLTQERCAAALGISFQQLQKYEKGRNRIAACTLVRLAEVLEVAPDALLDDTTDPLTVPPRRRRDPKPDPKPLAITRPMPGVEAVADPTARRALADLIRALSIADLKRAP
ncbi:helix-turn-helix transcriptional regulator [Tistrella sp. BH-R2-4]|uniref:Helix-turn-helix transcriptional regulator n=1 Tax=Tistrella arctica TaxID=3133430 RepID=A0ABU9YGV7_9PROT